jgi:hypothetical protein
MELTRQHNNNLVCFVNRVRFIKLEIFKSYKLSVSRPYPLPSPLSSPRPEEMWLVVIRAFVPSRLNAFDDFCSQIFKMFCYC